jgi:16S rRNA (guanine966-N2)-methyltransferase
MRIIAGTKKGMKLISPKDETSRPILDRVKESVFDILYKYNMPQGRIVADLFCGVGSFGLESLSRGAELVTFVEKDPEIAAVLKKNIVKADFTNQSRIIVADVFKVGASPDAAGNKYDLVFVDPPYKLTEDVGEKSQLSRLLNILEKQTTAEALVLVRTHYKQQLLENYGNFHTIERRRWGTMMVTFVSRK